MTDDVAGEDVPHDCHNEALTRTPQNPYNNMYGDYDNESPYSGYNNPPMNYNSGGYGTYPNVSSYESPRSNQSSAYGSPITPVFTGQGYNAPMPRGFDGCSPDLYQVSDMEASIDPGYFSGSRGGYTPTG